MLFGNPEALKTMDEIIQIAIDGMTPETKVRLEAVADELGCSLHEAVVVIVNRNIEEGVKLLNSDWEQQPYGQDPRLQRRTS